MLKFSIGLLLLLTSIYLLSKLTQCNFRLLALVNVHNLGERLLNQLLKINRFSLQKSTDFELIEYKFFTGLVKELLVLRKDVGVDIFPVLQKLKSRLKQDIEMERKLNSLKRSAITEICIVMIFCWVFVFIAKGYVDIQFNNIHLIFIFIWQLIGFLLLFYKLKEKKQKYFSQLSSYLYSSFSLEALFNSPVGMTKLLDLCHYKRILNLTQHEIIREHFKTLISQLKSTGELKYEEVEELSQCVVYQFEFSIQEYQKSANSIKLIVLMIFFMSSFLMVNFSLMSSMLNL